MEFIAKPILEAVRAVVGPKTFEESVFPMLPPYFAHMAIDMWGKKTDEEIEGLIQKKSPAGKEPRDLLCSIETPETPCDYCLNRGELVQKRVELTYHRASIGPFVVKDALVYECPKCSLIRYSEKEAKGWEKDKALELLEETSKLPNGSITKDQRVFLQKYIERT